MPDTPAPAPATEAKGLFGGLDPRIVAGALLVGLSLGVVIGTKIAKVMAPPPLPHRGPCPDCEQRKLLVTHRPAPTVVPPQVAPEPPMAPVTVTPDPTASFSAQAVTFTDDEPVPVPVDD